MKNVALCDLVAAAHTSVASADEHKEFRVILKCIARGCLERTQLFDDKVDIMNSASEYISQNIFLFWQGKMRDGDAYDLLQLVRDWRINQGSSGISRMVEDVVIACSDYLPAFIITEKKSAIEEMQFCV